MTMTMTYTWKTPKGAKVEMTVSVEHITKETISADGNFVDVVCDRWERKVESCRVNGSETRLKQLGYVSGKDSVIIDRRGLQDVAAALPVEVIESLYGEERRDKAEKLDRELAIAAKVEADREAVRRMMGK